jgi:hypothetical protein
MKKLFELLTMPWRKYKERVELKRKLAELRKRDPFIYK